MTTTRRLPTDGKVDFADVNRLDFGGGIEQKVVEAPVGKLALAPAILHARAGRPAAANLAWTHPHRWKALRTLRLRARTLDGAVVGTVTVRTLHGRSAATAHSPRPVPRRSATTAGP